MPITPDPCAALPASWSASARETYVAIAEDAGDTLTPAQTAALYEAAAMLATADALDATLADVGHRLLRQWQR